MTVATVFNIQRYSVHDGPGIRTTVFLKGCPLACLWCANPESTNPKPELAYRKNLCDGCGRCLDSCKTSALTITENKLDIDRERCNACGCCVQTCFDGALEVLGKELTLEEVLAEVMKDTGFYRNTGGGVTVSGGEPLQQIDFLVKFLEACKKEGLSTAVDTSGCVSDDVFKRILPYTDLLLFDIKHINDEEHIRLTGKSNVLVLANLKAAASQGVPVWIRMPIVPGLNTGNLVDTQELLQGLPNVERLDLLPYHRLGVSKYEGLDRPYLIPEVRIPTDEEMNEYKLFFEKGSKFSVHIHS